MRAHGRSKWFRLIKEKNHNMRSGHVQAARRARSPSWTGMDILKELFGTSDELQISKSLFGSDASSTPVELGLGKQTNRWRETGRRKLGTAHCCAFAVVRVFTITPTFTHVYAHE